MPYVKEKYSKLLFFMKCIIYALGADAQSLNKYISHCKSRFHRLSINTSELTAPPQSRCDQGRLQGGVGWGSGGGGAEGGSAEGTRCLIYCCHSQARVHGPSRDKRTD